MSNSNSLGKLQVSLSHSPSYTPITNSAQIIAAIYPTLSISIHPVRFETPLPVHTTVVIIPIPRVRVWIALQGDIITSIPVLACAVAQPTIPTAAAAAGGTAHPGLLGRVAMAQVVRSGMPRQHIGVGSGVRVRAALAAEQAKEVEALASAVALGVVVGGGRADPHLLAAVANEGEADKGGEGKEDAVVKVTGQLLRVVWYVGRGKRAYTATIDTAKHAVSILHACLKLGSAVNPPFPLSTTLVSAFPSPNAVSTSPLQDDAPPRLTAAM